MAKSCPLARAPWLHPIASDLGGRAGSWRPARWFLARCPRHRRLQKQPPSSVPSVLAKTLCVFLSRAPRAASSVSQSSGAVSVRGSEARRTGLRLLLELRQSSRSLVEKRNQKRWRHSAREPRVGFSACPAVGCRSKTTAGSHLKCVALPARSWSWEQPGPAPGSNDFGWPRGPGCHRGGGIADDTGAGPQVI